MHRLLIHIIICFSLSGIATNAVAKDIEFPAPKNAAVSLVGNNISVGGRSMSIRQFYTRDKIEKVKRFYHSRWEKGEIKDLPGYLETKANPPWLIISRLEQGYLLTVQMQSADDGGTWGYLASSPLSQANTSSAALDSFPKLPGSRIIHDMQTKDIGQSGITMLISNEKSLDSNTNYYKNYYQQHGWRTDLDLPLNDSASHILAFTNGRQKVNLVFKTVDKSTVITVNKVTHDIM